MQTSSMMTYEPNLGCQSVTSVRNLYQGRRLQAQELAMAKGRISQGRGEQKRKEKEKTAYEMKLCGNISLESRLREEEDQRLRNDDDSFTPSEGLISSSYIVVNDISFDRLSGVVYKTELIRRIRHCLGAKGQIVLLRSSLHSNSNTEEEQHECRQALMSLFIACIDQLQDDVPHINFDRSSRSYECILRPKQKKNL